MGGGRDRGNEMRMVDIIVDYQTRLKATPPPPPHRRLGPMHEALKLWDVSAIVAHCRTQMFHMDLRRAQERLLRKWIEGGIAIMKKDGAQQGDVSEAASNAASTNAEAQDLEDSDEDEFAKDLKFDANVSVPAVLLSQDTNHLNRSLMSIYQQRAPDLPSASSVTSVETPAMTVTVATGKSEREDSRDQERLQRISLAEERISAARAHNKKRPKLSSSSKGPESKKQRNDEKYPTPSARLSDLGGVDNCIEEVLQLIGMPLKHPEIYLHLGIQPPRGILLHGPPGCGKTALANAIAGEMGVPFINISAPSVVSGMSGESEKKIREVFDEARELAPCLIFIDEIDAITPKRETAQREMERRIVAQLLTCLDDLSFEKTDNKAVIVIGATNRPDSLDPALRRAGRFDREISIGVPDADVRAKILEKMCSKLRLEGSINLQKLAKLTPGYVGADLGALTAEAGMIAVKRIFNTLTKNKHSAEQTSSSAAIDMDLDQDARGPEYPRNSSELIISDFLSARSDSLSEEELGPLCITHDDFTAAIEKVQPSSKREGFATVPDVSWEDVGALGAVREELRMAIVEPIRRPLFFKSVGIVKPMGVLLYGPPGCGKTLLAKAVANESCCNFISVKGPELLNKFVGESERGVRQVFARAAASSPCVIFFDELDALCPARSNETENQSSSRLVNTLLTELDGMQGRQGVYIIAATNRPDMIDPAILRPGRLDKTLYVDLPTSNERAEILRTLSRKTPLRNVDLTALAADSRCESFSGADLAALVREAAVAALRETLYAPGGIADQDEDAEYQNDIQIFVTQRHFETAFSKMAPSVSKKDRRRYELLRVKFSAGSTPQQPTGQE